MRLKGYDVALLVLAVVTAGAIWVALSSVGSTPATQTREPAQASASTDTPPPADQATTSEPPASTEEPPASTQESSLSASERFTQALAGQEGEPVDVVVLGDDTSNLRSEWVQLWGRELAASRAVTVVQWAEMVDIRYAEPEVLSETGAGGPVTIWSASRTGADIESVSRRLGLFLEPGPDVVLINLGANNDDAAEAVKQLQALVEELEDRIADTPVALIRQGEGGASDDVDQALAEWADEQGLLVIDARSADSAQEWAELVVAQTF